MSDKIVKANPAEQQLTTLGQLTPQVIKDQICKTATNAEIGLFLNICKNNNLDPFKREVYLVKYGGNPAMTVTGYEVYLKRAQSSGQWNGFKVWTEGDPAKGTLIAKCEVYRKDWTNPFYWEVDQKEGLSSSNPIAKQKPKHMLKKTCISQALRMCFPDEVGGLPYTVDETGTEERNLSTIENADAEVVTERIDPASKTTVEIKPQRPVEELKKIDIHTSLYGGTGVHKAKKYVEIPLGYLKSVTDPKYWDSFSDDKKQAILDTIEFLSKKEREKIQQTATVAETVKPEPTSVEEPIGQLTPSSIPFAEKEDDELIFNETGEMSTVAQEEEKATTEALEQIWLAKLKGREWEIDESKKGENPPDALIELVTEFLKVASLFTPIEKEKLYNAITGMKRNMAIAQYNQIVKLQEKRFNAVYGK